MCIRDSYYIYGEGGDKDIQAKYALKVLGFATRTFRQPLQVGIPKSTPILFDVGAYRPMITVSGLTPREANPVGQTVAFKSQTYYTPTYFQLQHAVTQWNFVEGEEIILTVLHTNVASVTYDQYNVSIQSANFGLISTMPNFWSYELAFVGTRPVAGSPSQNI